MFGGIASRHMSARRRGSSPMFRVVNNLALSLENGNGGMASGTPEGKYWEIYLSYSIELK